MKDNMPTIANFQMTDKIFDLIKYYSETDELNINYSFEGDWGNWNWLYNKIIEDFVHNNPDYHVIKKSDGDVMGALELVLTLSKMSINPDDAHAFYAAEKTIRAALQQPKAEWLPIETAPKDGTSLLIATQSYEGGVLQASYCDHAETFIDVEGDEWWDATHWMPLPTPPQKGEDDD